MKTMRERFDEKFTSVWNSKHSEFIRIPDGIKSNMMDFIEQELKKEREEIVDIIKNSRTVEENIGIGVREDQARTQAIVDILSTLLKTEHDKQ